MRGMVLLFLFCGTVFGSVTVKLDAAQNFSTVDTYKLHRVLKNLEFVINTSHFKHRVLTYSSMGESKFQHTLESNSSVYEKLMSGREILSSSSDGVWNFSLRNRWLFRSNVSAYTYSNDVFIYFNSRYFSRASDAEIAGTLCHEYAHKLGYVHPSRATPSRPFSVPYAVGDICEALYVAGHGVEDLDCGLLCSFGRIISGIVE
jgi:hypothetical protein